MVVRGPTETCRNDVSVASVGRGRRLLLMDRAAVCVGGDPSPVEKESMNGDSFTIVARRLLVRAPRFRANWAASRIIPWCVNQVGAGGRVLNIGSGDGVQGIQRRALRKVTGSSSLWVNLDLFGGRGVSVIADAAAVPIRREAIDVVICQAVLEHVERPVIVVSEIGRVLREGGLVYCEIPFLQPYHAVPRDYQRYTRDGIRRIFRDFEEIECGVVAGPGNAIRKMFVGWGTAVAGRAFGGWAMDWLWAPIEAFDWFLAKRPNAHKYASALFFLGRRVSRER